MAKGISQVTRAARPRRPVGAAEKRTRRPGGTAAITILYIRPMGADETPLDARLAIVARRYAPAVELRTLSASEAGHLSGWTSPGSPAVLLLRRGAVIGQALGDGLPVRELDEAVRRAVEWPAAS